MGYNQVNEVVSYYDPDAVKLNPNGTYNWKAFANRELFDQLRWGKLIEDQIKAVRQELLSRPSVRENTIENMINPQLKSELTLDEVYDGKEQRWINEWLNIAILNKKSKSHLFWQDNPEEKTKVIIHYLLKFKNQMSDEDIKQEFNTTFIKENNLEYVLDKIYYGDVYKVLETAFLGRFEPEDLIGWKNQYKNKELAGLKRNIAKQYFETTVSTKKV